MRVSSKVFLHQLASATSAGDNEQNLNFALSVVTNIKPNDHLEAMLAAHMAVTHMLAMRSARRLALAESLEERDSAERAFNKLTRTLTTQIEALKRYRTGVEQRVTVQNVSVNDGGQAIVGDVVQARRHSDRQQPVNATRSSTDVRRPAMPLVDELKGEVIH
jgi:hypothetical protein